MKPIHLLLLLPFLSLTTAQAQLSDTQSEQIDSLFLAWNEPGNPGGAVGIMQNGEVVFSKAYGLASLEYQVPNTPETIFNTGSVSKQFTAMAMVRLQEQGLVNIDEDIRTYLPELPDFGTPVTIRHMLHHTSGMRSLHAMLSLAGWRDDDSRTNADLYRFMLKQKELNFPPGEEFLYCNTGYMLMVNILENVTREKFPKWMKDNIFDPLNMPDTYVENRYDRIVPNNATSYYGSEGDFFRAVEYWGYVGSGNMHSTIADLLTWLQNFSTPEEGWASAFTTLQTTDTLNDGSENNYAFGVNVQAVNGHKRIAHGGAIGGFRAQVSTFPEAGFSIAILTNLSSSNPGQKEGQIARILMPESPEKGSDESDITETIASITLATDQLKQFEGSYWNDKENYARKIYLANDSLRYQRTNMSENALIPIGPDEFQMADIPAKLTVKFEGDPGGNKAMIVQVEDGSPSRFEQFDPVADPTAYISTYAGRYYSPELESILDISMSDGNLVGHHARHGDFPLSILKEGVLEIPGMAVIKFEYGGDSHITGIRVSNGRARNVWFEKQQ